MEKLVIRREFTHKKGDKAKGKPAWSDVPEKPELVANEKSGYTEVWYNVTASNIGAEKAVAFREISMPTTADECKGLASEDLLRLVRLGNKTEQELALSRALMDTYETEERKAKRVEKAIKDAKAELGTFMEEFLAKGQYPSQEQFVARVAEVQTKYGVNLSTGSAA